MASRKLDERLEQLRRLRSAVPDGEVVGVLRKSLRDKSNLVVAEAAKTIASVRMPSLIPDLVESMNRLFDDPIKSDPKCWGKTAIAKALTDLDYDQSLAFLRGARHVQMEPVWGGHEDAAPQFRGTCLLALVQCSDLLRVEVFRHLVDALTDPADPVRLEAVRALSQLGGDEANLLLRLKARSGDKRSAVTGQVFDALLALDPRNGVPFVAEFMNSSELEVRDEGALALGSSRLPEAVDLLIKQWNETKDREFGAVLLRAMSSSRQQVALDFLLNLVRTGSTRDMTMALDALKLHADSTEIQAKLDQARKERPEN